MARGSEFRLQRLVDGAVVEEKPLGYTNQNYAIANAKSFCEGQTRAKRFSLTRLMRRRRGWPLNEWEPYRAYKQDSRGRAVQV